MRPCCPTPMGMETASAPRSGEVVMTITRGWFQPAGARAQAPSPNIGFWSWARTLLQPQARTGTGRANVMLGNGPGMTDAPQFGQLSYNPIGAGVVATARPQASYGPAGQYEAGTIFWTAQDIPTSIALAGVLSPDQLNALLANNVKAAYRVG